LDKKRKSEANLSIAAVEREVGLSKDVLRVWERRYGFPAPDRDGRGERSYPADQVRRLALIKRLMDRGHRPGGLLRAPLKELQALAGTHDAMSAAPQEELETVMRHVREHDELALADSLQRCLTETGLQRFVLDKIAPLAQQVGHDWARGDLQIHEEHLFTEVVKRVLRQAIAQLPRGRGPVVLLTTLPDEPHGLGLLMLECFLALQGARCVNLGTQMPMLELVRAAQAHLADIVAVSFSAAFPARQAAPMVRQLRAALAPDVQLWVGGAGASRLGEIAGVQLLHGLEAAASLIASQAARGAKDGSVPAARSRGK
jgi:DNA-binding transcriptional MerR regulator/methylmalonyl-CoA mutase cobalamin-binding subunit